MIGVGWVGRDSTSEVKQTRQDVMVDVGNSDAVVDGRCSRDADVAIAVGQGLAGDDEDDAISTRELESVLVHFSIYDIINNAG